jgi:hypothetical protein
MTNGCGSGCCNSSGHVNVRSAVTPDDGDDGEDDDDETDDDKADVDDDADDAETVADDNDVCSLLGDSARLRFDVIGDEDENDGEDDDDDDNDNDDDDDNDDDGGDDDDDEASPRIAASKSSRRFAANEFLTACIDLKSCKQKSVTSFYSARRVDVIKRA